MSQTTSNRPDTQNLPPAAAPLLFQPGMETPEEHEADTVAGLEATLATIRETTLKDTGQPLRSVHAKSHGILKGTLTVPALPPTLAQGMFAKPGTYDVIMRFSTIPGDLLSDNVSTPRGLAIKVLGVEGNRLPGSEGDSTQDFVMVDGPAFGAPSAAKFLPNLKLLAGTTDRYASLKGAFSQVARGVEALIEAFGGVSPTLSTLGGHPATNILGTVFYSQTPFLYGPHYAKFSLAPHSANLKALAGKHVPVTHNPDAIRAAVVEHFAAEGGEWALQVQLATDADAMPVENAAKIWPEDRSPYVTVATLSIPPQNAWSDENRREVDDGLSFSPWHGLAAHRPLGGVNRARKATYQHSAAFRAQHNGCPMHEPKADAKTSQGD